MTGFEKETAPLNDIERRAAYIIAQSMRYHVGPDKAVTSSSIAQGLADHNEDMRITDAQGKTKPYLNGARLRKIMNYIRRNHLCKYLLANSDGYYLARSSEEVARYLQSLDERIQAIQATRDALKYELQTPEYTQQQTLF